MSLYQASVPAFTNMLHNMSRWLDKAADYAATRTFDPAVLLGSRLAPDQFPLMRQVQAACDSAKNAVSLLSGREPPKHPDTEQTFEEIRARIATVITYLDGFAPERFEGAESRVLAPGFLRGGKIAGQDYLSGFALPNFYFHVSMTYAILRHNGVPLGKTDYIGRLKLAAS